MVTTADQPSEPKSPPAYPQQSQQYPLPHPEQYSPQDPQYYGPMPPRKDNTKKIVAIALIIGVVIIVVVAALIYGLATAQDPTVFEGAELKYDVSGSISSESISGTAEIEIIEVTSNEYRVRYSYTGIPGLTSEEEWFPRSQGIFVGSSASSSGYWGTLIDQQTMFTIVGVKEVNHYREVDSGDTYDYYVTTDKELPVRMIVTTADGNWMQMDLSYTNISYYTG